MSHVNVSLPKDGTTADVADFNKPLQAIESEINGNLDNSNVHPNASISQDKLDLQDGALTTTEVAFTVEGGNLTDGSVPQTTSTSFVDFAEPYEYTTGDSDELLFIMMGGMNYNTGASSVYVTLHINDVSLDRTSYTNNTNWTQFSRTYMYEASANTTYTLQVKWYTSGNTAVMHNSTFHGIYLNIVGVAR